MVEEEEEKFKRVYKHQRVSRVLSKMLSIERASVYVYDRDKGTSRFKLGEIKEKHYEYSSRRDTRHRRNYRHRYKREMEKRKTKEVHLISSECLRAFRIIFGSHL